MAILELKLHDILTYVDGKATPGIGTLSILSNQQGEGEITTSDKQKSDIYLMGKDNNIHCYSFYIINLSFHKRIYQPTEVNVVIDVYPGSVKGNEDSTWQPILRDPLTKAFTGRRVSLLSIDPDDPTNEDKKKTIGDDFYLSEVHPQYRKDSMSMVLKIFSLDKQLTLYQDSRTFVAKKLCAQIITDELKKLKNNSDNDNNSNYKITLKNNMKVLSYEGKDNKITEHIFPYLVQYNESFYDMIIRTANRWGEFVYYEDGCLNVGYDATANATKPDDWTEISYCDIENGFNLDDSNRLSAEAVYDENVIGNALDKDPTVIKAQMGCNLNNGFDMWIMNQFPKIFGNTKNLPTLLGNMLFDNTYDRLVAERNKDYLDKAFDEKYFNGNAPTEQYGFSDAPNQFHQFSELNSEYKEDKYRKILMAELQASKNAIQINYDTTYPNLKLGQLISVYEKEYMVIDVQCRTKEKRQVVDEEDEVITVDEPPRLLFQVIAISKNDDKLFYPTVLPSGHVRTSGPQLATVTDAEDPLNQNRVRVMFNGWQTIVRTDPKDKTSPITDNTKRLSSPWIVYATSSASQGNGIFGKHYEGDQVIVSFAHDNVERPYIVGGLSTKGNKVPGGLLERDIVLTSPGGHALRIEDGTGAGLTAFLSGLFLPSYNLLSTWFPSLSGADIFKNFDFIKKNSKNFEGGFQLTDKYGIYTISGSTNGRNVTVKSAWGDVSIDAFTGITISAPNGDISIKGKNISIEAGNNLTLTSGTNVSYKKFKHGDTFLGSLGYSAAEIPLAVAKKLASKLEIIDLTFIRSLLEVFFRPVEGALTVKSNRFLKLEAGKSECDYPVAAYKDKAQQQKIADDTKSIRDGLKMQAGVVELVQKVGVLAEKLDRRYITNYNACVALNAENPNSLLRLIVRYRILAEGYATNNNVKICRTLREDQSLRDKIWAPPSKEKITEADLGFEDCFQVNDPAQISQNTLNAFGTFDPTKAELAPDLKRAAVINARKNGRKLMVKAANELRKAVCEFLLKRELAPKDIGSELGWFWTTRVPKNYKKATEKAFSKKEHPDSFYFQAVDAEHQQLTTNYNDNSLSLHRKALKRQAAVLLIEELGFKDEWRTELDAVANLAAVAPPVVGGPIPVPPPPPPAVRGVPRRFFEEDEINNDTLWNAYVSSITSVPKLDALHFAATEAALNALKGLADVDTILDWHKTRKENSSWSDAKNGNILFTSGKSTYSLGKQIREIESAGTENLLTTDDQHDAINVFLNAMKEALMALT